MAKNVTDFPKGTNGEAKLPDREVLMNLSREVSGQNSEMAKIRGELGSTYKEAEKDRNIHKAAFKLCVKLKNMDDTKRDEFLTHLDHYRDKMGIDEGRTQNMFGDDEAA